MSVRPDNTDFLAKYDALLARWPVTVDAIDIPGRFGTTHVNACGPTDGPAVVLMHGGRATSTVWYGIVGPLARTHRVYAIDLIGDAGRSVDDGEPLIGGAGFAQWLDDTLDALGVTKAAFVAHSLGTWVSMRYALHAPERVTHLALLDPSDCLSPTRLTFRLRAIPLFVGRAPGRWRSFITWETQRHPIDPQFLDLWASPFRTAGGVKLGLPRRPPAGAIADLRIPTLVVVAGRSRQNNPRRLAREARRLPDVRVVTLAEATHFTLPQEYPGEVGAALDELLGVAGARVETDKSQA